MRVAAVVVGVALLFAASAAPAAADGPSCSRLAQLSGGCPTSSASASPTDVTVTASETNPGHRTPKKPVTQEPPAPATTGPQSQPPSTSTPPITPKPKKPSAPPKVPGTVIPETTTTTAPKFRLVCSSECGPPEIRQIETKETPPTPVTIADISTFHPLTASTAMEPSAWMVIGLQANFISTTGQHVVAGPLLGRQAEVRFTPVSWHWDYGDGSSRDTANTGAAWAELGLDEFARTPTSHAFQRAGTFTIVPTIQYTAEYRYAGDDWVAIDGLVTAVGPAVTATAGTASTVLVPGQCGPGSTAPGC